MKREFGSKLAILAAALAASLALVSGIVHAQAQQRPNIVMLMGDDVGWNDFGA